MHKRVIVVDDDPEMRQLMHLFLNKTDYQVVAEGEDGDEAVALYEQWRPDCVLLDLMMPRVDGLTALRQIMQAYPDANVVICSAKRTSDTVREAYSAGARDYITKPFGRTELQRALARTAPPPPIVALA